MRWENKYYVFAERGSMEFEMIEVIPGVLDHGRQQILHAADPVKRQYARDNADTHGTTVVVAA